LCFLGIYVLKRYTPLVEPERDTRGQLGTETQALFFHRAKESCQELTLLVNHVMDVLAVTEEVKSL
jgi:hypothetical protein